MVGTGTGIRDRGRLPFVMQIPETRYALSDGFHIAYQVMGEGPPDLITINSGPGSHIENQWDLPAVVRIFERMSSFARVVSFDNRGAGLSDPVAPTEVPSLEEQVRDAIAVMDDLGSKRAVLVSNLAGASPAAVLAATHPDRVQGLVMYAPWARVRQADDYQIGLPDAVVDEMTKFTLEHWGRGDSLAFFSPSAAGDVAMQQWYARMERTAAAPRTAAAMVTQWWDVDVRSVLPSIDVPTLVIARTGQPMPPVALSRYVAENIPGAEYLELPGVDAFSYMGDYTSILDAMEEFVTGGRRRSEPDRWLGTVLFIDIVDSTGHAAAMGDERWRDTLQRFHQLVERQLARFDGRLVDTAGDGALAVFPGPARAIDGARSIRDAVRSLDLQVRAGVHTGEMERMPQGGVGGIAVHIGARVAALAGAGEVYVSRTVKDLVVGARLDFETRGEHTLKGVPGTWEVYAVT
jgi:pimeloyl-ACP methyl ester carboxylesterase/class 3 adenylate cyclase